MIFTRTLKACSSGIWTEQTESISSYNIEQIFPFFLHTNIHKSLNKYVIALISFKTTFLKDSISTLGGSLSIPLDYYSYKWSHKKSWDSPDLKVLQTQKSTLNVWALGEIGLKTLFSQVYVVNGQLTRPSQTLTLFERFGFCRTLVCQLTCRSSTAAKKDCPWQYPISSS